jgi:hypothetical protein
MNRWRVGEDRGSKEKDRCPLTQTPAFEMAKIFNKSMIYPCFLFLPPIFEYRARTLLRDCESECSS